MAAVDWKDERTQTDSTNSRDEAKQCNAIAFSADQFELYAVDCPQP